MAAATFDIVFKETETPKSDSAGFEDRKTTRENNDDKFFLDDPASPSKKQNTYKEPVTHLKNRSPLENFLGGCFGDVNAKLTNSQLENFYKIREDANIIFNAKYADYDYLFKDLWEVITRENLDKLEDEKWKEFGFQNSNPRSDIRGGGLISLKQLLGYTRQYTEKAREMMNLQHEFLFAASSINVTFFLCRYYHMSDRLIEEKRWKELCSRTALKTLCNILDDDRTAFDRIHSMLLEDLFASWIEIKRRNPNITILDFNIATDLIKKRYKKATSKKMFDDFEALQSYYNKKKLKISPVNKNKMGNL